MNIKRITKLCELELQYLFGTIDKTALKMAVNEQYSYDTCYRCRREQKYWLYIVIP